MVHRYLGIEVAFNFDENSSDLNMKSFCNFVSTIDNGEHADAVKNAIQQFLAKETKKILTDKEAKKIDITYNDIASGLCMALYLSTDYQVHFASQTKEKVSNKDLFEPIKRILLEQLKDFFKRNPAILKTVTAHIKKTAKLRLAMMSAKKVVLKDELRGFKDYGKKNFLPANNKGKNDYREIIVVEGDSAGGSMGIKRGEVVPIFKLEKDLSDIASTLSNRLYNLPNKIKMRVNLSDETQSALNYEIEETLKELKESKIYKRSEERR